jgi:hypothetical protein
MSGPQRKEGKKHRKYGRAGRRPSHTRYNNERRWEKNKARKAARIKKQLERKAARKAKKVAQG